jgi:hypothetical protein
MAMLATSVVRAAPAKSPKPRCPIRIHVAQPVALPLRKPFVECDEGNHGGKTHLEARIE